MIFDEANYPRPSGATDFADSSHLAGLLAIVEHPSQINLTKYWVYGEGYVRHPLEDRYDFSRDQAILLMAGLLKQRYRGYVRTKFIKGKDLLPPSLHGMEEIAMNMVPRWYHKAWAKLEIWVHAELQPLEEPNQIIAMCETYDLYKYWTERNVLWRDSIRHYWSGWRGEEELAEFVIQYIESKIRT